MSFLIRIFLLTAVFFSCNLFWVADAQEMNARRFISLGEGTLEKGIFQFESDNPCRSDVILFSKKLPGAVKVSMTDMSSLIKTWMKMLFIESFIPDDEFIEKNTFFYSVPSTQDKVTNEQYTPWQNGYDIAYTVYQTGDLIFLWAFTGTHAYGSTYVYIKKINKDKPEQVDKILLSKILTKEAFDMLQHVKPNDAVDSISPFPPPKIPAYFIPQTVCLVRSHWFGDRGMPATDYRMNEWFTISKKINEDNKKREKIRNRYQQKYSDLEQNGKELVKTPKGRLYLLEIYGDESYRELEGIAIDNYRKWQYREVAGKALSDYYLEKYNEYTKKHNKEPEENDIVTPEEVAMFFELFRLNSSIPLLQDRVISLIRRNHCKSLIPALLKMTSEKELAPARVGGNFSNPNDPNYKPPKLYHYAIFQLLTGLGDETTCKQLQNLIDSKTLTPEKTEDAKLAIENIQKRLAEEKRVQEQQEAIKKRIEADRAAGKAVIYMTEPHDESKKNPFWIWMPEYNPNRPKPTLEEQRKAEEYEHFTRLPRPFRFWKSVEGYTCRARLLEIIDGNKIKLGHSLGEQYQIIVDIDRLSDEDKEYIKTWPDIQTNGEPAELKFRAWIWNFPPMGLVSANPAIYVTTTQDN
ncbi:MAG: hypothetical protein LBJ67_11155, partial [Planctomycetaceae bacterium]|nr:hypothetical protein [Planctomycetaceae bacterium]